MPKLPSLSSCYSLAALVGILAAFGAILDNYRVPAYQGIDENGYIITAKLLATHHGNAVKFTSSPYEFVSGNMVETLDGIYYAKYPIGYPALCAAAYRWGGPSAVFLVNPLLAALSIVGIFFLGRRMVNDWAGALAAILLATNPLHAYFGLSALSHSGSICFAVWGMLFVWKWAQDGGWLNATLGGLLTAYGVTVRYTEALLILPMVFAATWRFIETWKAAPAGRRFKPCLDLSGQVAVMGLAGLLTLAPLLVHHWVAYGSPWTNGYTLCAEDTGFSLKWFDKNWRLMLNRMNTPGLFMIFPIGLAGLIYLVVHDVKRGIFLALWVLPTLLLYTAYYWAPEGEGPGYIRFFTSLFPPLIVSALALMFFPSQPRAAWNIAMGLFVLLIAGVNLNDTLQQIGQQSERLRFSQTLSDLVRAKLPDHAVIFSSDRLFNFLEFAGNYYLYPYDLFERGALQRRIQVLNNDDPHPFQRRKAQKLADTLAKKSNAQLAQIQRRLIAGHLARNHLVAIVASEQELSNWRGRLSGEYQFIQAASCLEINSYQRNPARPTAPLPAPQRGNLRNFPPPVSPRSDLRSNTCYIYLLKPRGTGSASAQGTSVVTPESLTEKIDQMQFQTEILRTEYNEKYPGALESWSKITDLEKEIRDLRDQLKKMTAKKGALSPPVKSPPAILSSNLAAAAANLVTSAPPVTSHLVTIPLPQLVTSTNHADASSFSTNRPISVTNAVLMGKEIATTNAATVKP